MAITKVTNSLVATNAIQGTLIADNAITSVHIAQNQVTAVQIPDGSITAVQLGANSVDSSELVDGSIDTSHIANGQITESKLAANSVRTAAIAQNQITSKHIADGSITDTQLGSGAFTMGNITTTGAIRGPASLTIDPATVGDNTGTVVIAGNLQVDGTTTTVNSTTLDVADKNITIGKGQNEAGSGGSGITVDGSNATILWDETNTSWDFNNPVTIERAATADMLIAETTSNNTRSFLTTKSKDSGGNNVQLKLGTLGDGPYGMLFTLTNHPLTFATNNAAPQMTLLTSGNFGIGDLTPDFKLTVRTPTIPSGSSYAWPLDLSRPNADSRGLSFGIGPAGGNHVIAAHNGNVGIGHTYGLDSNSLPQYYETLTVTHVDQAVGNVGIGETSPDGKLHIKGATATGDLAHILFENTQGSKVFAIGGGSTGVTNSHLYFRNVTDNTRPMVITDAGNIGIGGIIPVSKLHLSSANVGVSGAVVHFLQSVATNGPTLLIEQTGGGGNQNVNHGLLIKVDGQNGGLGNALQVLGTNNNLNSGNDIKALTVKNGGNVGIGTDTPDTLLHVNGQAKFENNITLNENTPALVVPNGDFRIFTGGEETLRVTSTNNLKFIAKTTDFASPGFTYHTNNYLYLRGGSAGLIIGDDSNSNTVRLADGTSGYFMVETGNGTERIRVDSAGTLRVTNADGATNLGRIQFSSQAATYQILGGNNLGYMSYKTGGYHRWIGSDGSEDMRLTSDGKLTVSAGNLDVNGEIQGSIIKNIGSYNRITDRTAERYLTVNFPNGVAHQKVQLVLANTWWGELEVTISGTFSNQNMAGSTTKKFGTGLNANTPYTNVNRITETLGATADNFHIGDIEWNASLAKWVIVISHRVSTGNQLGIRVRGFAEAISDANDMDSFYTSAVYTTDTTVYGQQVRKPNFLARRSSNGGSYNPFTYSHSVPYNDEVYDEGGNFDTSTGLFTAPLAGMYLFQGSIYTTSSASGGWVQAWLTINGARGNYTDVAGNGMNTDRIIATHHMVKLSVGETVGYHPYAANATYGFNSNVHHTYFMGAYIG